MSDYLYVDEIFGPTIQGEGDFVGKPCYFIRLNGCDQNPPCKWCDTMRSYSRRNESLISIEDIIKHIDSLSDELDLFVNRFVITGGNPCAQDCSTLIDTLKKCYSSEPYYTDCEVNIETQGTQFPKWLDDVDYVVVSPKPPSSSKDNIGQDITNLINYCKRASSRDHLMEIKVVIFNEDDMQYAIDVFVTTFNAIHGNTGFSNIHYTLQLGTSMNAIDSVYSVDDIFAAIKKSSCRIPRMLVKDMRVLPQVHNILKVR